MIFQQGMTKEIFQIFWKKNKIFFFKLKEKKYFAPIKYASLTNKINKHPSTFVGNKNLNTIN